MSAPARAMPCAPRVVLDTNACLDLWHFVDPRAARLATALTRRDCIAVGDARSRAEWERVLGYATLALGPLRRASLLETWDAQMQRVDASRPRTCTLPRCADPDDQFWLELARDAGAVVLITRDAELLVLDRRASRDAGFRILTPQAFVSPAMAKSDGEVRISRR